MNSAQVQRLRTLPFVRAVRYLQRRYPDRMPVGYQGPPSAELLRFAPRLGLEFQAAEIFALRKVGDADLARVEVETCFFGLYGTGSPLPAVYTEELLEDGSTGPVRGLLDVFNHRLLSLLARALQRYRFVDDFEWRDPGPVAAALMTLCTGLRPRDAELTDANRLRLMAYTAAFAGRTLSAEQMEVVISHWLVDVPVKVEQCVPQWLPIPVEQRCQLGVRACRLGRDLYLGGRVLDAACKFRVVIGPLSRDRFLEFLPGAPAHEDLRQLVDRLNRTQLDSSIQLRMDPEARPAAVVGEPSTRLGWCCWIGDPGTAVGAEEHSEFHYQEMAS